MPYRYIVAFILLTSSLISCTRAPIQADPTAVPTGDQPTPISPTHTPTANATVPLSTPSNKLSEYAFPDLIDPAKRYLFSLHGKIIEDQGIPAISPNYGEYEYEAILEKLSGYGFVVISEERPKNTDTVKYARKISQQVTVLLDAGVPEKNIAVVGASKGAGIAVFVSHFLENEELNFVLLAICHPDIVKEFKQGQIILYGNVLSIYDSVDEFAGSCQELFLYSEDKGIGRYDEVILEIGSGHGILYEPLDTWMLPVVQWLNNSSE